MITYTLIRSKRKTVALHVTPEGQVEVRAPLKLPRADIDRFVESKNQWLEKHLKTAKQNNDLKENFSLDYGDPILLLGQSIPIVARAGSRLGYDGESFYLPPNLPPDEIKRVVIQIYTMVAKRALTYKVNDYSQQTGLKANAVKITAAKTRWGSCSGKGSLNFSWRLIMAPDDVIDYVVVHELAHTKELNHSDKFWAIVASILPDYKERESKLKDLEKKLKQEDWD